MSTSSITSSNDDCQYQSPPKWPRKLILVQRRIPGPGSKVSNATVVTYYDSDLGGNLIQITPDNNDEPVLWDLELDTHHSYYFYPDTQTCTPFDFPVGILKRDFLQDAQPLGESFTKNGKQVCGWTKLDFIDYYADKHTGDPVSWYFHTMKATFSVISYQENPTSIDPALFVPPDYCFV